MKKYISQIFVGIVCALLGFLLTYQYKVLSKEANGSNQYGDTTDLLGEIESLKKEKEELSNTNASLTADLKKYEESAAGEGSLEQEVKNQLDVARMQLGTIDVTGKGIVMTITPKSNMFGNSSTDTSKLITDQDILKIVNTLYFGGAEAISVNDFRITGQTGFDNAGTDIWIGKAGRIKADEQITIKAIGDPVSIKAAVDFESYTNGVFPNYNVNVETEDSIVIQKTTETIKNDYVNQVAE